MKKLLLLVAAATLTLSATAESLKLDRRHINDSKAVSAIQVREGSLKVVSNNAIAGPMRAKAADAPEGTIKPYALSGLFYSFFGMMEDSGLAAELCFSEDGSKISFGKMFPSLYPKNGEVWIQGNVSTDGTSVVFPMDTAIGEIESISLSEADTIYQLYPAEVGVDEEGYFVNPQELVLKKDGDKIYMDDDPENFSRYIALISYESDGSLAVFDICCCLTYEPFTGNTDLVELPAGAEPAEFVYKSVDLSEYSYLELGKVYVDGNDVYMNGLAPERDLWVKGTKEGNTVTFKSGQYLGEDSDYGYYTYFEPFYVDGSVDEEGYTLTFPLDAYVLTYDPETGTYSNSNTMEFASIQSLDYIITYRAGFNISPYAGDKPAIPSDPYGLYIEDYMDWFGQYYFGYTLDNVDVDGNFLNPDNLYYYLYLDGEIYTLTPEVFVEQTEPELTLLPYNYSDGYDVGPGHAYIGESLFTTLGVQAVYICDGVTNYSNVVSVDLEGNVTVEPAPQGVDGLNSVPVKQISSMGIYDAQGRKLDALQKGVNIVKMVAADGSVKVVKMYSK